jgi:orotidine-5'-phosphate decarboxylase
VTGNAFVERLVAAQRGRHTLAVLGVDPQLDFAGESAIPEGYSLSGFCCEIVEACAPYVAAIKPQLAFFEARGIHGLHALVEVLKLARSLDLVTIADAKRGDIGSTSAAYAEAFLGNGDFACDAMTVNPYLGTDAIAPFIAKAREGRGIFMLVKTSNPSASEFQDLNAPEVALWKLIAKKVHALGREYIRGHDFTPIGAVVGATYPADARQARELMPNSIILVPGYGTQGGNARDAVAALRTDGLGVIVNASRKLMYAWRKQDGKSPGLAAAEAADQMRRELDAAAAAANATSGAQLAGHDIS